jgi:hypothetical protein
VPFDRGAEHDADAIYLPAAGMVGTAEQSLFGSGSCGTEIAPAIVQFSYVANEPVSFVPWHPPDSRGAQPPLFLKLRTIRI